MYTIAVNHPISHRRFPTRTEAIAVCTAWGFGSWRVRANLRKDGAGAGRVPAA